MKHLVIMAAAVFPPNAARFATVRMDDASSSGSFTSSPFVFESAEGENVVACEDIFFVFVCLLLLLLARCFGANVLRADFVCL